MGQFATQCPAGHYAIKLFDLKFASGDNSYFKGSVSMVSDGSKTSVSGCGSLFTNFLATKHLFGYVGEHDQFSTIWDVDYDSSILQIIRFDQSFKDMPYDVRQRKF